MAIVTAPGLGVGSPALALQSGMIVADVGAGTGYFTRELAARVAPDGRVLAADIIPEFLAELEARAAASTTSTPSSVRSRIRACRRAALT